MNRLDQLYEQLGFNRENGLFYLSEYDSWIHNFPYRISRLIKEVIKPIAFFCIFSDIKAEDDHPTPFNKSFIFFFDNPTEQEEENIHKHIINFSLAQLVFINRDYSLDLFHGNNFENSRLDFLLRNGTIRDFDDYSFVNQLNGSVYKKLGAKSKSIDTFLLNNIIDARRILVAKDGLNLLPKAANRLIGRLLFISYLIDRDVKFSDQEIIKGTTKEERKKAFRSIISNRDLIYKFFSYLTDKHNGEIFPLIEKDSADNVIYNESEIVNESHLNVLSHLFNCASFFQNGEKYANYVVQRSLFDLYDFEVIPVELISSIYETFIGKKSENEIREISKQQTIKAYYTPPYIVDYILSQTVVPFLENKNNTDCKILDPACGSGIFLVEALRKIIEKEISLTETSIPDDRLWSLIKANIYGIDIDADAIDITIFSLYVTILDYKKPAEIENFKFKNLKGENLFGGDDADFFNIDHEFNNKIKDLNFIVGNPPWGKVSKSKYVEYIRRRNSEENKEKKKDDQLILSIGDKEICQAFLVRTSDFARSNQNQLKCSFVITSKILYNSDSKSFRNYFLQNFKVRQMLELSPINNKIRGGNHVFDTARYPASIITFEPELDKYKIFNNIVQHITVKPNIFFTTYKSIVIERHDVKKVKQRYFIEKFGGFDWLWKTLIFGNHLDFQFIDRLKSQFKTVAELGFNDYNGGFKAVDGDKQKDASVISKFPFLDAEKGFTPYFITTPITWEEYIKTNKDYKDNENVKNGILGYIPLLKYFQGNRVIMKKGVVLKPNLYAGEHYFGAVTAFCKENVCYTATVAALLPPEDCSYLQLNALTAMFNSKLFTYYALNTGSSIGVEKSRFNFEDFFNFPLKLTDRLGELAISITQNKNNEKLIFSLKQEIEEEIHKVYNISKKEASLIDFALNISIPTLLREKNHDSLEQLDLSTEHDKEYISKYTKIFQKHFVNRFKSVRKKIITEIIYSNSFLRINFHIVSMTSIDEINPQKVSKDDLNLILGELSLYQVSKKLFVQQDVRGFTPTSFYVIKPNERKVWHAAVAYIDAQDFEQEIVKAEISLMQKEN